MNKVGGNKLLTVYWFLILTLVAGGVIMMVNSFYSSPYDVRVAEAEILSKKVANCVMEGGSMSSQLTSNTGVLRESFLDNFMDICELNFDVETEFERPQYYLEVDLFDANNLKKSKFSIVEGNKNWKEDCNFKEPSQERVAKCIQNDFYVVDAVNKLYFIKILTVVGKTAENVK